MKYIVIGLGNYGAALAVELSQLGHEVVGVDISENKVNVIKDKIATAFILDASDDMSLNVLPLNSVEAVVVAIGENFGASVRVTAMLKQAGVKHIYARAIDSVHKAILAGFGIDRILTPEENSADSLADQLDVSIKRERLRVGKDYSVCRFVVPEKFVGLQIGELKLKQDFNLNIIAVARAETITNFLGFPITKHNDVADNVEYIMQQGDELVCYGKESDFRVFWNFIG